MASTIILRRRITSIKSTRQITKAMQLVSASKLRRAQMYANASKAYGDLAYELLKKLNVMNEADEQTLFKKREIKNRLYILITSNTGLAGAYNSNVIKLLLDSIRDDQEKRISSNVIVIGSKGAQFVRRLSGVNLMAAYPPFSEHPTANEIRPILNMIIKEYEDEKVDDVRIIYTQFNSTVNQKASFRQLLPAEKIENEGDKTLISNFEPDIETVVEQVITRLIEAQIWQSLLQSLASEHAMRMIATKNATDNANELIGDYTLELNTVRQAAITQELAEISGGVEALQS